GLGRGGRRRRLGLDQVEQRGDAGRVVADDAAEVIDGRVILLLRRLVGLRRLVQFLLGVLAVGLGGADEVAEATLGVQLRTVAPRLGRRRLGRRRLDDGLGLAGVERRLVGGRQVVARRGGAVVPFDESGGVVALVVGDEVLGRLVDLALLGDLDRRFRGHGSSGRDWVT